MTMSADRTAIRPILLNVGKMSGQRRRALIGGNSRAKNTWGSVSVVRERRGGRGRGVRGWWCWLEPWVGQGDGDVLHLPHQQSEVRDDDGRSEGRKRNPSGILHEPDR